ncbi:MAG: hypothetical protein WBZ48_00310 [Bacteroidota bacterium]
MNTNTIYKTCQIREGDETIIAIAHPSFALLSPAERVNKCHQLQIRAGELKKDGTVILCWKDSRANSEYLCPPKWDKVLNADWPYAEILGSANGEMDL